MNVARKAGRPTISCHFGAREWIGIAGLLITQLTAFGLSYWSLYSRVLVLETNDTAQMQILQRLDAYREPISAGLQRIKDLERRIAAEEKNRQ